MKNVLYVKCSPRGSDSISIRLADELIKKLNSHHKKLNITTLDFAENPPTHLTGMQLNSFFTPPELQTSEQKKGLKESDHYIEQLKNNDIIVISYPVWNYLVPSSLKSWIDQIVRPGLTFHYEEKRPKGLIKNKKVYLVLARGGIYPDQYNNDTSSYYDFSVQYMKTVLSYLGMVDISVFKAEGTALPNGQDDAFNKGFQSLTI